MMTYFYNHFRLPINISTDNATLADISFLVTSQRRCSEQSSDVLYPSLVEAELAATTRKLQSEHMPKNIFSTWTTGFTTVAFLTTSYYPGIAVSVSSLACNPGNAVTSCFG
jgi:hypothetical protein